MKPNKQTEIRMTRIEGKLTRIEMKLNTIQEELDKLKRGQIFVLSGIPIFVSELTQDSIRNHSKELKEENKELEEENKELAEKISRCETVETILGFHNFLTNAVL